MLLFFHMSRRWVKFLYFIESKLSLDISLEMFLVLDKTYLTVNHVIVWQKDKRFPELQSVIVILSVGLLWQAIPFSFSCPRRFSHWMTQNPCTPSTVQRQMKQEIKWWKMWQSRLRPCVTLSKSTLQFVIASMGPFMRREIDLNK